MKKSSQTVGVLIRSLLVDICVIITESGRTVVEYPCHRLPCYNKFTTILLRAQLILLQGPTTLK